MVTSDPELVQELRDEVSRLRNGSDARGLDELRGREYGVVVIILFFLLNRFL